MPKCRLNLRGRIMKKQILIVDDLSANRSILYATLSHEYDILEAFNGEDALDIICNTHAGNTLSAIVLDLIMPIMDGFEFLEKLSELERYKNIPVLVITASSCADDEERTLRLGAWDFISKPYNSTVLKHRLSNIIARSELHLLKELQYLSKYDATTGILNKENFIKESSKLIQHNPSVEFAMIHMNIKHFNLVNSFFGVETTNRFLRLIADLLRQYCSKISRCAYARTGSESFALFIPYDKAKVESDVENMREILKKSSNQFSLYPSFGIYVTKKHWVSPSIMLDGAIIATRSIKEDYINCFAYYVDEFHDDMEREQDIISQMEKALENEEFEVWFQPKYNAMTQKTCGAEALVRWRHPEKGLITPETFIPIFERNGFIQQLDKYVWTKTCHFLKKWRDMGLDIQPISVNVSRVNLYNPQLDIELVELVNSFDIPPSYMPLEITESIFSKDVFILNNKINKLKKSGFSICMDDFGSGYSSLNVLKDVSIDTLKIDMEFFSDTENMDKSKVIIRSVVQMAADLGLKTIAEGVEQAEQAEFLRSINCDRIQGYLYAKPMPANEYQVLITKTPSDVELCE